MSRPTGASAPGSPGCCAISWMRSGPIPRRRRPRSGWSTSPRCPVYRVANTAAAYRGAVIDQEMDALAEAVALDVMQVWIADLHRTVEESAPARSTSPTASSSGNGARGCSANRVALARHRHQGLQRLNTALAVVEKLRLIETELAGALSAELRAALAFARGGAGAGSR